MIFHCKWVNLSALDLLLVLESSWSLLLSRKSLLISVSLRTSMSSFLSSSDKLVQRVFIDLVDRRKGRFSFVRLGRLTRSVTSTDSLDSMNSNLLKA